VITIVQSRLGTNQEPSSLPDQTLHLRGQFECEQGQGNSGTLLATLFAPRVAQALGWPKTFAVATLPVFVVLVLFTLIAKNNPLSVAAKPSWRDYAALLREADTGWFCFFYSFTFGGFVGLASFLTIFFHDQYFLSKAWMAGGQNWRLSFVADVAVRGGVLSCRGWHSALTPRSCGAALRHHGHTRNGERSGLPACATTLLPASWRPHRTCRRRWRIRRLRSALHIGRGKRPDRSVQPGLFLFAAAFLVAAFLLLRLGSVWRTTWNSVSVERAGIFCYRSFARSWASSEN
jgi:hypothetical protein